MHDELNKKIAEWLGFKLAKAPSDDGFYYFTIDGMGHPANFTYSLDACFEYIYPKLSDELVSIKLLILLSQWIWDIVFGDDKPALTLCLAVEKLIDATG